MKRIKNIKEKTQQLNSYINNTMMMICVCNLYDVRIFTSEIKLLK